MYKIFLTVRNRMSLTIKCINSIINHSTEKPEIYVYDNLTNYKINEHFMYWSILYQKEIISQVTFNTKISTFNAFSKAVACNQFGHLHEMDPNKDKYDFLLFLDNDIIVTPQFDKILKNSWVDIKKNKMNNIKIVGQLPGGIKSKKELNEKIGGYKAKAGFFGGSGLWSVRPNFFREIGFLEVKDFINIHKKHDQNYWRKLGIATNGKEYIMGIDTKLGIHCGSIGGSICNTLTRNKQLTQKEKDEKIKFKEVDEKIDNMTFNQFYDMIKNNNVLMNDW